MKGKKSNAEEKKMGREEKILGGKKNSSSSVAVKSRTDWGEREVAKVTCQQETHWNGTRERMRERTKYSKEGGRKGNKK